MSRSFPTCKGESIPIVELALAKQRCLRSEKRFTVKTPADVARFLNDLIGCKPQEHFVSLFLSIANEVIGVQAVSVGGISATPVDPRVVLSGALVSGCSAIIIAHNHPSGEATPSAADEQLTSQLIEGARLVGIKILDHLVIGRGGAWTSLREQGRVAFAGEGYGA